MTTPFEVSSADHPDGSAELRIRGACDGTNAGRVTAIARNLLARKVDRIVVNLEDLEFISSAGVGCLIGIMDEVGGRGGRLILARIRPEVKNLFDLLGLSRVAECAGTVEEARAALTRPRPAADASA